MPIRRLVLDVDKVVRHPDMVTLARAMESVPGVQAVNITVNEIDVETIGTIVTVVGDDIDSERLFTAISNEGAVLHSIDEVVVGDQLLDPVPRRR
ncbi:DUF211 domain-containing protein [Amnibacterium sp.]|uniref:DUF211 domain-containing protein n=1 Tax=Amnibacterium sp. TaxID=1872496 RepID=UPI003F7BA606